MVGVRSALVPGRKTGARSTIFNESLQTRTVASLRRRRLAQLLYAMQLPWAYRLRIEHSAVRKRCARHAGRVGFEAQRLCLSRPRCVVIGDGIGHIHLDLVPRLARSEIEPRDKLSH